MRIAILDDYQGVALEMADWSDIAAKAHIKVFRDHVTDQDTLARRLEPFEVLCVMRERTPLSRALIERLPNLRLIVSTGSVNASIDTEAASAQGVQVAHTGYFSAPAIEMTWALILAAARHVADEVASVRLGGWPTSIGMGLFGKKLGLLGLGRIGSEVARIGRVFGMDVIAWSENLTTERAEEAGAKLVSKEQLFAQADVLSIHLVLSRRTRGIVDAKLLSQMKRGAVLINTSRGPLVDEKALIQALEQGWLAAAAVDVFDVEPLPSNHPFRSAKNILPTPHIGYVVDDLYKVFYQDAALTFESGWRPVLAPKGPPGGCICRASKVAQGRSAAGTRLVRQQACDRRPGASEDGHAPPRRGIYVHTHADGLWPEPGLRSPLRQTLTNERTCVGEIGARPKSER